MIQHKNAEHEECSKSAKFRNIYYYLFPYFKIVTQKLLFSKSTDSDLIVESQLIFSLRLCLPDSRQGAN